uniref:Condensin complex subunit 2 n=1 Tax=Opuntia streptacantha TaxID=393608 RepID=A0A7C9D784_OPUST
MQLDDSCLSNSSLAFMSIVSCECGSVIASQSQGLLCRISHLLWHQASKHFNTMPFVFDNFLVQVTLFLYCILCGFIKILCYQLQCLGKCIKRVSGSDSWQQGIYSDVLSPAWDDEGAFSGHCDDGFTDGAVEQDTLIPQPRQVNKIELQYDRTSKQVDVHMLKETLWHHMLGCLWTPGMQKTCKDGVSFRRVLATLPEDCPAAATHDDISPHLCFICILHLANEHGLTIRGYPNLDDLSIHLPVAFENADEMI